VAGSCGYGEGLFISKNAGNFLTSCKVYWLASQEGLAQWSKYVLGEYFPSVLCSRSVLRQIEVSLLSKK
jgi:hypothetical protein